jgi:predicted small lipoprotein YifL
MRTPMRWLVPALLFTLTLAACGNRTPLRLPEPAGKPAANNTTQGESK